jgi:glutathione reductase (NADPH)
MDLSYDLVALGTGTAAKNVAKACRRAGWRVAVVDCLPYGGTCALRGCDPQKALWSVAHAFATAQRLQPGGIEASGLQLDWPRMMAFKRTFTDPVPEKRERQFKELDIDTFHGTARFMGPNTVAIGDQRLDARHVLIATGAKPAPLPIPGAEHAVTSSEFLELYRLPKTLITIGGGYIGCEFAHTATRGGAKVTVLQRGWPLPHFDLDMVRRLADKTRQIGVDIHTHTNVEAVEKSGGGVVVHATHNGRSLRFTAEMAVHSAGRVPATDALDLERRGRGARWRETKTHPAAAERVQPRDLCRGRRRGSGPGADACGRSRRGSRCGEPARERKPNPGLHGRPERSFHITANRSCRPARA